MGGTPVSVPGMSLRAMPDTAAASEALRRALAAPIVIFTSPAAVRFAARLMPLATTATVLAVGRGTARALHAAGVQAVRFPETSQDSEGVLGMPELQSVQARTVGLVGAPGGRGLLQATLAARGAALQEAHVYARAAPRVDRRHVEPLLRLDRRAVMLLSSAEALAHLQQALPAPAWRGLMRATAVVSSDRLRLAAEAAGFTHVHVADSATSTDLLAAAAAVRFGGG